VNVERNIEMEKNKDREKLPTLVEGIISVNNVENQRDRYGSKIIVGVCASIGRCLFFLL
jgi:hypothetical protein